MALFTPVLAGCSIQVDPSGMDDALLPAIVSGHYLNSELAAVASGRSRG